MDPADVEVYLGVDDNGVSECLGACPICARIIHLFSTKLTSTLSTFTIQLAHIWTNPVVPFVPPSVENDFEVYFSVFYSTGSKRKGDTVTAPAQKRPATEATAPSPPRHQGPTAHCNWSPDCTSIIDESLLTRVSTEESEDLGELAAVRPVGCARTLREMAPPEPLELPGSSNRSSSQRVWESYRPSNLNFTIYEDPPDQETPNPSPLQEGFHPQEEDKENIFVSRSDFDSSDEEEEEETHPGLAWNEASIGPRDAFGLPLNRNISDFVQPRATPFPERPMRHGREVLRTIWVDETQVPEEDERWLHDGSLTDTQIREIGDIEASYQRGQLSRARSNHRQALRDDAPVHAPTNFHTDVRRILHFQRHEDESTTPDDSPLPTGEDENEFQRED
ncbi:hypothetical protein N7463_008407 [Penicillium fimorum]|uniref:Uncharacterized protein n=1 Tax=Penicillium fimorum TaxID=1882269 RepID=A0A9X0C3P6_9EURO|nr:hypothetical protein N7463_008407 [Penicillium fimorum]